MYEESDFIALALERQACRVAARLYGQLSREKPERVVMPFPAARGNAHTANKPPGRPCQQLSGGATPFATLCLHPTISNADFVVI